MEAISVYVLKCMLTLVSLDRMQNISTLMCKSSSYFYWPFQGGTSLVDHLCYFCAFASALCCLVVTCWERADLLALVCGVVLWDCYCSIWYPVSGVVLDCFDSWNLPPFLLSYCTHSTTYIGCSGPMTGHRLHTNWLYLDPRLLVQFPSLLKFCVQLQNGLQLHKK